MGGVKSTGGGGKVEKLDDSVWTEQLQKHQKDAEAAAKDSKKPTPDAYKEAPAADAKGGPMGATAGKMAVNVDDARVQFEQQYRTAIKNELDISTLPTKDRQAQVVGTRYVFSGNTKTGAVTVSMEGDKTDSKYAQMFLQKAQSLAQSMQCPKIASHTGIIEVEDTIPLFEFDMQYK